ncbi:MAG: helix-turn-helix domain-containing protein [Lachnospiraceae bacterium]|nr:helix-turn-helix domain-containing protein [Lachnospiraceae bacterium]
MKKKKYRRIRFEDRKVIEEMLNAGSSIIQIATRIETSSQTIYNEIRRCPIGKYNASQAQESVG